MYLFRCLSLVSRRYRSDVFTMRDFLQYWNTNTLTIVVYYDKLLFVLHIILPHIFLLLLLFFFPQFYSFSLVTFSINGYQSILITCLSFFVFILFSISQHRAMNNSKMIYSIYPTSQCFCILLYRCKYTLRKRPYLFLIFIYFSAILLFLHRLLVVATRSQTSLLAV